MVKRRRRQYPARQRYGSKVNTKLLFRIASLVIVIALIYYGYPQVADWFSGNPSAEGNTEASLDATASKDVREVEKTDEETV